METYKQYSVYAFESISDTIEGKYFVAADNLEAAKIYANEINNTISQIIINVESGIEFKNLKYICPHCNNKVSAICIINGFYYKHY